MHLVYCQGFFSDNLTGSWKAKAGRGRFWGDLGFMLTFPELKCLVLVEVGLAVQLGPSHTYPYPAEAATNYGSLCSSK